MWLEQQLDQPQQLKMSGLVEGQANLPQAKEEGLIFILFFLFYFFLFPCPQGNVKKMRHSLKTQVFLSFLESLIIMT